MTVFELYTYLADVPTVMPSPYILRDPPIGTFRPSLVDAVYEACAKDGDFKAFGLTLNLLG